MRKWLILFSIVVPLGIARASVVTYMDTAKLARLSPVIVRGIVESVEAVEGDGDQIFTEITLGIVEGYRGTQDLRRIQLHQVGGRVGERESRVFGTASFRVGEEVIVFARPTKSGRLTVTDLFQGKLEIEYVGGTAFVLRSVPGAPVAVVGAGQEDPGPEPLTACSGVIALGGLSEINPFSTKVVHGQRYIQGLQGDVVLNAGADCFWSKPGNYEEVLAHEIGHTLGLGHSCGGDHSPSCSSDPLLDEAQMRAFAHGNGRGLESHLRSVEHDLMSRVLARLDAVEKKQEQILEALEKLRSQSSPADTPSPQRRWLQRLRGGE